MCFVLISVQSRPGKNRQNGKLLAGKSCDLAGKNKEIHKGDHPTLEGICPAGGKFWPACRKKKTFFPGLVLQLDNVNIISKVYIGQKHGYHCLRSLNWQSSIIKPPL